MNGKAIKLGTAPGEFTGKAWHFRLDPPLVGYDDDGPYEYVVVSATHAMFTGPETYIFPADEKGEVTGWGELPGSYKGGLNYKEALRGAGYDVE